MTDAGGGTNMLSYFGAAGRHWSLRRKVFTYVMIPAVVFSLVIGGLFIASRLVELERTVTSRAHELAVQLADLSGALLATKDFAMLSHLASAVGSNASIHAAMIYDARSNVVASAGTPAGGRFSQLNLLGNEPDTARLGDYLLIIEPIWNESAEAAYSANRDALSRRNSMPAGWITLEYTYLPTQLARTEALLFALFGMLLTVILSAVLASRLSSQLTRPLSHTLDVVSRIKRGERHARLNIDGSREVELLRDGINSMAETLERSHMELQDNIDQATEDLRETLEMIEIQNIELNIARKDALQASRIKSEFLANMSHEIRTPLNGIVGFARILLKSSLSRQQKDYAETIVKSSETLLNVINDVLDFSKIEAGKLLLDRSDFNIRDMVDEALTLLAPAAHEKNLDLATLVYFDVPEVLVGDPMRIKQIIINLVGNAVKFTRHGEVLLRIMLADEGAGDADNSVSEEPTEQRISIRIAVTDTGVGMSQSQQRFVFNAFSQADASTARRFGGSGLGLVISRKLAEQMGGGISVESALGKGSTFAVTLRLFVSQPQPAEPASPRTGYARVHTTGRNLALEAPNLSSERLIYLDYQQRSGLSTRQLLEHWNAEIVTVDTLDDLESAVVAAQTTGTGFSAAIIGITIHQLSSAVHLAAVERIEKQFDCRVIILTPTVDNVREHIGLLSACSAYALKPVPQRKLAAMMALLIDKATRRRIEPEQISQLLAPRRPTILAVDDNAANLKLIETLLADLNVEPIAVTSGYEAVRVVKERACDLVFMDVQMPGMDGLETTRLIRSLSARLAEIPILALTAHALDEEREALLASGFDEYLTKPISEIQLRNLLGRYLKFDQPGGNRSSEQIHSNFSGSLRPSQKRSSQGCVDPAASIALAAGKRDLAVELLSMLLENLPDDSARLRSYQLAGDTAGMEEVAHRLHGGTRYCGVPPLRNAVAALESAIRRNQPWKSALQQTFTEIDRLLYFTEQSPWQDMILEHEANASS